jgi:Sulfatase
MADLPVNKPAKVSNKLLLLPTLPIIFFFLHCLNNYKELILTKQVVLLFFIYIIISLFIFWLCKKLIGLTALQSLFLSPIIFCFFVFFGALQDFLFQFQQYPYLSNSFVLLSVFISIVLLLIILCKKRNYSCSKPVKYLFLLFIILSGIEIVQLAINIYTGKTISALTQRMRSDVLDEVKIELSEKPDIYHIIFDSYTNSPALKQYWGYENDLYPFLQSRGFFTVDSGYSNYASTPYSISSVFNLQYLKGAEPYLISNSENFFIGQRVFRQNAVYRFFERNNYDFSVFAQVQNEKLMLSTGITGVVPPTTWIRKQTLERIHLNPWLWHKIKKLGKTGNENPPEVLRSMQQFNNYNKQALNHLFIDCKNASLRKSEATPLFSFTHILLPHDPYLYNENGALLKSPQPDNNNMSRYLGQLKYSNSLIKKITDCLLKDTIRKKIIIIQGDHGYRHYTSAVADAKFGALNAFYFYNKDYNGLRKNMSHVNTYRVIFNKFFGTSLPLLEDRIVHKK